MWVIFLIQPKAVLAVDRNHKELCIGFLLYFHCMKSIHQICKAVLSFAALGCNVDELFFDLSRHGILRTESIIEQKRGSVATPCDSMVTGLETIAASGNLTFDFFFWGQVSLFTICVTKVNYRLNKRFVL